jgi:hypothetical protein
VSDIDWSGVLGKVFGALVVGWIIWVLAQPSASPATTSSQSSECTADCSGHDAGYKWGQTHDITDTDYDNGNSDSFNEGVRTYAEENQ